MGQSKRGRPVTGSPKRGSDGRWTVRVPIPNTNRTRPVKLGPEIQTEERATEVARHWHEKLKERPDLLEPTPATMTNVQYLERWTEERKGRVVSALLTKADTMRHVFDDAGLANKPAAKTTRDDLRGIVARLNAKVEAGVIQASTATKVWVRTRCMYRAMFDHELDSLRIRDDDPTAGVRPPKRGKDKQKAFLYPDEACQLFACQDVPFDARRMWALMIYTGTRVSELEALDWSSVDLAHGKITIHESVDRQGGEDDATKETKTGEAREIDILPALRPLLEALHEESGGKGRVSPVAYQQPALKLREHLMKAGVTRAVLHTSTKTLRRIRAQDLRATAATWLGLAEQLDDGGRALVGRRVTGSFVRDFLGHSEYETTERYYERGRGLRVETVGQPFGPLPDDLVRAGAPGIPATNTCQSTPGRGGASTRSSTSQSETSPLNPTIRGIAIERGGAPFSASRRSSRSTEAEGVSVGSEQESSDDVEAASAQVEHVSPREQVDETAIPATVEPEITDPIESALADAIGKAAAAGAWDAIAALTAELRARREARAGVVRLDAERKRRERR